VPTKSLTPRPHTRQEVARPAETCCCNTRAQASQSSREGTAHPTGAGLPGAIGQAGDAQPHSETLAMPRPGGQEVAAGGERNGAGDRQDPHGPGEGDGGWWWGHLSPVLQREAMPVTFPRPRKQPWLPLSLPMATVALHAAWLPPLISHHGGPLHPMAIAPHPSRHPLISCVGLILPGHPQGHPDVHTPHDLHSWPPLTSPDNSPPIAPHPSWPPLISPDSSPLHPVAIAPHPSWLLFMSPWPRLMISPHDLASHPVTTPHLPSRPPFSPHGCSSSPHNPPSGLPLISPHDLSSHPMAGPHLLFWPPLISPHTPWLPLITSQSPLRAAPHLPS